MTVTLYEQSNKVLLENPWEDTSNGYYFNFLANSYIFDKTHTDIFDIIDHKVGDPILLTNRITTNTTLICDSITATDGLVATYGVVFLDAAPVFYINLGKGEDYEFSSSENLSFDHVLSTPPSTDTFATSMTPSMYNSGLSVLYAHNFADEANIYTAQLLNDLYTFSASHSTRSDVKAAQVGAPVVISNGSVAYSGDITTIDCDDINLNVVDAAYLAIIYTPSGASNDSDKLVSVVNFQGGEVTAVDRAIPVSSTGLYSITRAT